jgi:hypothetical protein
VDPLTDTIRVPRELLKELIETLTKVEEILATLEELDDPKGLKRIAKSEEDLKHGRLKTAKTPEELNKLKIAPATLPQKNIFSLPRVAPHKPQKRRGDGASPRAYSRASSIQRSSKTTPLTRRSTQKEHIFPTKYAQKLG